MMTKGIENFLNIADHTDEDDLVVTGPTLKFKNDDTHESETEDIRKKAISAFDDLMILGQNVDPSKAARVFEVAGQMLKTGLDAANSKSKKKLEVARLKLDAEKLQIQNEEINSLNSGLEIMADRNSLIKQMRSEAKKIQEDAIDAELEDISDELTDDTPDKTDK
jgi:hypothetical protein